MGVPYVKDVLTQYFFSYVKAPYINHIDVCTQHLYFLTTLIATV